MPADQPSTLAARGGEALVAAMPTPAWAALREEAVEMLHDAGPALEGVLVPELDVNARMLATANPDHAAPLRELLTARWSENLTRVLAANPAVEAALRHLVERIGATASGGDSTGKAMTNIARDHATLFAVMDGNIIHHHYGRAGGAEQPFGAGG